MQFTIVRPSWYSSLLPKLLMSSMKRLVVLFVRQKRRGPSKEDNLRVWDNKLMQLLKIVNQGIPGNRPFHFVKSVKKYYEAPLCVQGQK